MLSSFCISCAASHDFVSHVSTANYASRSFCISCVASHDFVSHVSTANYASRTFYATLHGFSCYISFSYHWIREYKNLESSSFDINSN